MEDITLEKCQKLRQKYPNYYPIILQNSLGLPKTKLLVPKKCTVAALLTQIRTHNKLKSNEAYFLFINNTLPIQSSSIETIFNDHKNERGYLLFEIRKESTFG